MADSRARLSAQLLIGCLVIALGVLFTFDNLGLVDSGSVLRWWPLVVVLVGFYKLSRGGRRQMVVGGLLAAAGLWLLLANLALVRYGLWDLWPLLLVFAGASLVVGSVLRTRADGPNGDPADYANVFVMMGGVVRKMLSERFRGGETTAVMGGIQLDLRNVTTASDVVVIQVLAWWGGIELFVPRHWKVTSEVMPILAGYEDQTQVPESARTHLIVRGLVVMGGVEVKN